MSEHTTRIVTAAQLNQGYCVRLVNGTIVDRPYVVVRELSNGTFGVREPVILAPVSVDERIMHGDPMFKDWNKI